MILLTSPKEQTMAKAKTPKLDKETAALGINCYLAALSCMHAATSPVPEVQASITTASKLFTELLDEQIKAYATAYGLEELNKIVDMEIAPNV